MKGRYWHFLRNCQGMDSQSTMVSFERVWIFCQKSCFLGPIQLVIRKVNDHNLVHLSLLLGHATLGHNLLHLLGPGQGLPVRAQGPPIGGPGGPTIGGRRARIGHISSKMCRPGYEIDKETKKKKHASVSLSL